MKRLLIPFIALALCPPAQALDMSVEIAKLQIPKIQRHQDASIELHDKGLLDAACSENESAKLLMQMNYSALVSINPIWGELYENSVEISETCALL